MNFLGKYFPIILIGGALSYIYLPRVFWIIFIYFFGWGVLFLFFFILDKSSDFEYFKNKELNDYVRISGFFGAFFVLFLFMFGPAALFIFLFYISVIVGGGLAINFIAIPIINEMTTQKVNERFIFWFGIFLIFLITMFVMFGLPYVTVEIYNIINNLIKSIGLDYFF